jgi:TIGR00159 family protein
MDNFVAFLQRQLMNIALPKNIRAIDIIQVLLIAFFIYYLMLWIRSTRAYVLLRGLLAVLLLLLLAYILRMDVILWIFRNISFVAVTGLVIVFQPELRRALEQLGEKNKLLLLFNFNNSKIEQEKLSEKSIAELTRAIFEMSEVKTGALVVIEQVERLKESEKTGIPLDSILTSQLLVNIFEHNTPLHDGAVIIRKNRIVAATCYLPLSNTLSLNKNLGTRHRAALGISETSDSFTIVVSEETGKVAYATAGKLMTAVSARELREALYKFQANEKLNDDKTIYRRWKGRVKNEENTHE